VFGQPHELSGTFDVCPYWLVLPLSDTCYRAMVTPSKRGKGRKTKTANVKQDQTPAERHAAMTWAQRLKRVFDIDIDTCCECGGDVKIIASIEDPVVIRMILAHLDKKGVIAADSLLPDCRASPDPPTGLLV
jgi:hypothetical protein